MSSPPLSVVLIAAFYAFAVGAAVGLRSYAAAAAIFTYGLGLALGCIYHRVKQ